MKMGICTVMLIASLGAVPAARSQITLGAAQNFAVLAATTVTNTGLTVVDGGSVGVSPGTAITGFGPGVVLAPFSLQSASPAAQLAQADLATAYDVAAALTFNQELTGQNLGGLTLFPGVYFFSSSAQLTGDLTLDAQGDPNAQFVFQIGSTLTTASDSSVVMINGGATPGCNVYWQIGSSATLGTGTDFQGHLMALTSITMTTGADIFHGSALARNGAVTLDSNGITACAPEPTTLMGAVLAGMLLTFRRRGVGARARN